MMQLFPKDPSLPFADWLDQIGGRDETHSTLHRYSSFCCGVSFVISSQGRETLLRGYCEGTLDFPDHLSAEDVRHIRDRTSRTGLRRTKTEIGKWRAETAAVKPAAGEPKIEDCRPETSA